MTLHFSPIHDHLDPDTPCACDNCEWRGPIDETNQIRDPSQRLSVGEPVPAGECPECGACAHIEKEKQ